MASAPWKVKYTGRALAETLDPSRCPLCGEANGCGLAAEGAEARASGGAKVPCWCAEVEVARGVLDRLSVAAKGRACVCARCAKGQALAEHAVKASAAEPVASVAAPRRALRVERR